MDVACETENVNLYYELNLKFHALVLLLANNQRAQAAYDDIIKETHLFRREYLNAPGNMRQSNAEHRTLYEAIIDKGSKAKAKSTAERHVLKGRERLLSNIGGTTPLAEF